MACNFMGDEWFVDSLNQKVRQRFLFLDRGCCGGSGAGMPGSGWLATWLWSTEGKCGGIPSPKVLLVAVSKDAAAVG